MKVPVLGSLAEEGRGGGKIAPIMQDAFTNIPPALISHPFHRTNFRPIMFAMELGVKCNL